MLTVEGVPLECDPAGALWFEAARALIVADLHLEKGSAFAARYGLPLPPHDTAATLARLEALVERRDPLLVVSLGDAFHDDDGPARLAPHDRAVIERLAAGRALLWIAGNHDPAPPGGLLGDHAHEAQLGPLILRHEPARGAAAKGEIAGHLHPEVRVVTRLGATRRRCVACDGRRAILPAFGAYAGGLELRHPAFDGLFGAGLAAYALGRDRVFKVRG
ncbi:MAG: ligase-associated DNA damage response endonuclease PdeM [Hyphomicrobiales bacterium]|nr:ligase-associated DNA damage response endonuclease PdeM [Hyphomicrobiales bacterium]MDE2017814.1 ligase-associated DNA damage response endonuclease PdeM [Hyphomicrobiales bacterium]